MTIIILIVALVGLIALHVVIFLMRGVDYLAGREDQYLSDYYGGPKIKP